MTGYLIKYCREVASVAPDLPFYFYHVPIMTNIDGKLTSFLTDSIQPLE